HPGYGRPGRVHRSRPSAGSLPEGHSRRRAGIIPATPSPRLPASLLPRCRAVILTASAPAASFERITLEGRPTYGCASTRPMVGRQMNVARPRQELIAMDPSMLRVCLAGCFAMSLLHPARAEFFWGNPAPQGNPVRAIEMRDDLLGYAVGDLGTSLRTTDGGVTWEDRTRLGEFTADLRDLMFDGEGALLAAGSEPGIFHSTDEGATWQPVAVNPPGELYNLFRIDSATISAVGAEGKVYRSVDDGASWTQMPALGGQELVDQWWHDAQRGYVIGPLRVRATTNGGTTWQAIPGVSDAFFFPGDIQFLDAMNGWILVDFTTYRTTDGGASWFPKHG